MFGLGMTEILMILALALIIIGPKKLPELAKTLGHAMGEFKRSAQDFKRSIDVETTVKDFNDIDVTEPSLKDAIKDSESFDATNQDPLKKNTDYPHENNISDLENETASSNDNSSPLQTPSDNPDNKS